MGKTKAQQAKSTAKVSKILKLSIQSPYFSYFETMPSKNSKDFVNGTLSQSIPLMHQYLLQRDDELEPESKRQKTESKDEKYERLSTSIRFLQKEKVIAIGLKETIKQIQDLSGNVLVFVLHDKEHESTNA